MSLRGKVAFVTGGSRGIGLAVVRALRAEGAIVAAASRSGLCPEGEERLACDVTDEGSVARAVRATVEQFGRIDIAVHSAGAAASAPLVQTDLAMWNRMLAVNLTGTFLVLREVLPGMIERGSGRVVAIASIAAKTGSPYIAAYAASKHGVLGLVRCAAQEVARKGVTVNAVCPGYVETDLTARSVQQIVEKTERTEAEVREVLASSSPQKRIFRPEEVAAVVLFLSGEGASGINGQAINLCGGAVPA